MTFTVDKLFNIDNIRIGLTYPSTFLGLLFNGRLGAYRSLLYCILHELSKMGIKEIESVLYLSGKQRSLIMPSKLSLFNGSSSLQNKILIYYLVRVHKPQKIIETGVWDGQTSWYILQALEDNGSGQLISIDIGLKQWNNLTLPTKEIGDFVPASLRNRWRLIIGYSKLILPDLLQNPGDIDMYYHDSDYSLEGMSFELNTVFPYLRNGGILSSDLVLVNDVFNKFSKCLFSTRIIGDRFGYGFKK